MPNVFPGFNPRVNLVHLTEDERKIVRRLSQEWYITKGGGVISLGTTSVYRYFLMKPTDRFQEMFNLEREIIVIFSPYKTFEPRTLDAFDYALKLQQSLRVERICGVIISRDSNIESRVQSLLKSDPESQIIVPFVYDELLGEIDSYFIRNRFIAYLYTRDLFAFEGPLKKDLYFFGRSDLVLSIVNRHLSNENTGLLGLRKTGKTSVIYGVRRALSKIDAKSVSIDCQNPAFHRRHWNKALYYLIKETRSQNGLNESPIQEDQYTEENAPILFEKELLNIYSEFGAKSTMIIFDEIENITFDISPTRHWAEGLDFVFFWQTLRSLYQKLTNVFTYMIVGTNPMCIERPTVHSKDNPIFNQIPFEYLKGFDVPQTREMVKKLGWIMGLKFDEIIYGKLTEDFGGHPFLIRHVCSVINRISSKERPTKVGKTMYEQAKEIFYRYYSSYIEMVLNVLQNFYEDEYMMLEYLARGDHQKFHELASKHPGYTNHLIGYGILEKPHDTYTFKTEMIRQYLAEKQKYKKLNLTGEEKLAEISERRNALEPLLRRIIRNQLKATYGKIIAKEKVVNTLGRRRQPKCSAMNYEELFDANKCELYFDDLRKIIKNNWDCFVNIFGPDLEEFDANMRIVNKQRIDAHAKTITQDEMNHFRVCIAPLERQVAEFLR